MFQYNLKVNNSYNACIFSIDKKRFYRIIYKRRYWLILKNRFKTFFSNFIFNIKFYRTKKRIKSIKLN